jgi:2-polyprenyl-6-hydroxyphenyl methylase/3-demethylubiquinone-9 3-methyltransferase
VKFKSGNLTLIENIMKDFFSKPYFKIWLKQASPEIKEWFQKEIEYLKKNIRPNSKILDVGCGFGRHIKILAPFSKEVVGIDNNKNILRKAKQELSKFKNVKLFLLNADKLSFDDNLFDYVICMTNTFGNFPKIKLDALKEMKRVCKKDGKIIISVYSESKKLLEIRKKDYKKIGLHITKIKNGIIFTEEGLISEQFSKLQLKKLFNSVNLKAEIIKLTPISYLCELSKDL